MDGIPNVDPAGAYNPDAKVIGAKMNDIVWQREAIHDGKLHGEKEWQAWAGGLADYGKN